MRHQPYVYNNEPDDRTWPFSTHACQALLQDETGSQLGLYIVQQGKFFGHEFFMDNRNTQTSNNTHNSSNGLAGLGSPREKMGMRALVDCSMYLLSEPKILHLVRVAKPCGKP